MNLTKKKTLPIDLKKKKNIKNLNFYKIKGHSQSLVYLVLYDFSKSYKFTNQNVL